MNCPLCKTNKDTIQLEKSIYIEDDGGNYYTSVMYGCKHCNILFARKIKIDVIIPSNINQKETVNKVQHMIGNISKGCNKILENIK
jgi:hypothetical protein